MQPAMRWILSSSLIFSSPSFAAGKLAGMEVIKVKVPVELELMTQHLVARVQDHDRALEVTNHAKQINKDLAHLAKANSLYLIKTEIYRNFLKGSFLTKTGSVSVNSTLIAAIRERLKKGSYTEFTRWFIGAALDDLDSYSSNGILDNRDKISRYEARDQLLAQELDKKLKFLSPWLVAFEKMTPSEFEAIVTETAIGTLKALSTKSFYFGKFASLHDKDESVSVFSVPDVSLNIPAKPGEEVPKSLTEQAEEKKQEANEVVKDITPDDLSEASEKIDEVIAPAKEQWTPQ